ncbi:hypothetical protein HPSA50_0723 [Helicobacter pylori SouthAfrica50]|uniref:Uncharacterized protein n=1 Tax=Helicobacter pylori SouthAfrica50 TaxID=1352357 RepID=T2S7K3_HELPX|nr:hypothetical protein HPSA50_0723 [Helicobacter pylori SouthAfrica50]
MRSPHLRLFISLAWLFPPCDGLKRKIAPNKEALFLTIH